LIAYERIGSKSGCLFILQFLARGQIGSTIILFGKVEDQNANSPDNVHIFNINNYTGTVTNQDGFYSLTVLKNDTIRFTSVGYKKTLLIVPMTVEKILQRNLQLFPGTLNLEEIVIHPYPEDFKALKKEFLALELPEETPIDLHLDGLPIQGPVETGAIIKGLITTLYEAFSLHGKIMRQYKFLSGQDKLKLLAGKKYNVSIVKKVTGLKEEQEIIRFIEYCKLEPEFIVSLHEYDLYCEISHCFERFQCHEY
jgi:hypothetical protein